MQILNPKIKIDSIFQLIPRKCTVQCYSVCVQITSAFPDPKFKRCTTLTIKIFYPTRVTNARQQARVKNELKPPQSYFQSASARAAARNNQTDFS